MSIINRIEAASYELMAPEKDALLDETKKLDQKIIDTSPLQKAVDKLTLKIQESRTWKERTILNEQLDELTELNILYSRFKIENITKNTKIKLKKLFEWVTWQINLESNKINDDNNLIERILEKEEELLDDTIDMVSPNTIRDTVEKYVNIEWVMESMYPQQYQEFFDIFTLTYIDYVENLISRKINKSEKNILIENKWLYITQKDFNKFTLKLLENLKKIKIDLNFNMSIKLIELPIEKDIVTINLEKIQKGNEEDSKKENERIRLNEEKEKKGNEERIRLENIETKINNGDDKLSTKQRMDFYRDTFNTKKYDKYFQAVIEKLEWTKINVNNKEITITKKYIKENYNSLLQNIKTYNLMLIETESDWKPNSKNWDSSAQWLWQWLNENWKKSKEYIYDSKWHTKKPTEKDKTFKERTVWNTSSLWTTLKYIKNNFEDVVKNDVKSFMPKSFNSKIKLNPTELNIDEQLRLLILWTLSNPRKVNKKWINTYLSKALTGDIQKMEETYKLFHHTNPDKKTLDRIKEIFPKYKKDIINIK